MSEADRVLGSGFEYNLYDREDRERQTRVCVVKGERNTWKIKQVGDPCSARGLASLWFFLAKVSCGIETRVDPKFMPRQWPRVGNH